LRDQLQVGRGQEKMSGQIFALVSRSKTRIIAFHDSLMTGKSNFPKDGEPEVFELKTEEIARG
jgi:hypothetical protein